MPLLLNGRVQVLTGEGLLTEPGISEERIVALNPHLRLSGTVGQPRRQPRFFP